MLKFLDKPITWKSYLLLLVGITVGRVAVRAARGLYDEYQLDHDYFDIERDNM